MQVQKTGTVSRRVLAWFCPDTVPRNDYRPALLHQILTPLATPTSSRRNTSTISNRTLVSCLLACVSPPTAFLLLIGWYYFQVRSRQPYTGWTPMREAGGKSGTLRSCWTGCHSKKKSVLQKMTGQGVQMPQSGESVRIGCIKESTVSCML